MRRRQQAQTAALNDLDGAVERLRAAQTSMAEAVARALQAFPSVDDLAEITPFDARELRTYERRHRREKRETTAATPRRAHDHVPRRSPAADAQAEVDTAPAG